jgi:hypothetical protein
MVGSGAAGEEVGGEDLGIEMVEDLEVEGGVGGSGGRGSRVVGGREVVVRSHVDVCDVMQEVFDKPM